MIRSHKPAVMPLEHSHFIDHHDVDWSRVRQTHYWMHQRFRYEYPGAVHELRQRLVVVPPDQHGDQRLRDYRLKVSTPAVSSEQSVDSFGNRVFQFYIPHVEESINFEIWMSVERHAETGLLPQVAPADTAHFLVPTALTETDRTLERTARELARQNSDPLMLAEAINTWTWSAMRYGSDHTTVRTSAAEALRIGTGLCQDYAHIMLAVCRAVGLPARYVSGHLLGEGGSHAWVEVLVPDTHSSNYLAIAFDPTNHCRAKLSYITVAVGSDYRDVAPTSGSFIAPFQGRLIANKRAGLTVVEFLDGTVSGMSE